jgi:hypothetical protein
VTRDDRFFLMALDDARVVQRQQIEEQFKPRWVAPQDALQQLTYPAEQEFARRALRWMEARCASQ